MIPDKALVAKSGRWQVGLLFLGGIIAAAAWGQTAPVGEGGSRVSVAGDAVVESSAAGNSADNSSDNSADNSAAHHEANDDAGATVAMPGYRIELDAPAEIGSFLEKYLDLYRLQKRKDLSGDDFLLLVDRAPQNAQSLLKTQGYFETRAETRVAQGRDGTTVYLKVDPGSQVVVAKVDVRVTGAIQQDEAMMAQFERALRWLWRLPEGEPFDQASWDDSKRRVLDYITARRYALATIADSKAEIDLKAHQATLTVNIDSGSAYVFGEVSIIGLEHYPEKVVREQIRFESGSAYQRSDLLTLQSELQNLSYFSGVVVEAHPSEEAPYVAPVVITVQEAPHNKLDLGFGYSTNYGLRLQTLYTYNNIFDRGWVFDSRLNLSANEQQAEVGLGFPKRLSGYGHRLYVAYNDSDIQGIRSRAERLGVSRSSVQDKIERMMSVEYVREKRHDDDGGSSDDLKALPFNYRWIRRDVITQDNPRRGNIVQLEGSAALKGLLTDASFARLYGHGIQYWPVGSKDVALARLEFGQTFSHHPESVPTDYLFRAGGSNSVRGYDYQSLGVVRNVTAWPGRVLATGTLEYQHMVYKDWRAAVFADYGDAANRWADWRGKTGVGVGARWVSPVGMLGTDLAYGVNDRAWRFYFSLGMSL